MKFNKIKSVFSKVISMVQNEIVLLDDSGKIIDSNNIKLIGGDLDFPQSDKEELILKADNYNFLYIYNYNDLKCVIGYKGSLETLNVIKLLFNEKRKKMKQKDFHREILLNNLSIENIEDYFKKFKIKRDSNYFVIVVKCTENIKQFLMVIKNLFVFDYSLVVDNETIAIITDKSEEDVKKVVKNLFAQLSMEIETKPIISVGNKVNSYIDIHQSFEKALKNISLSKRFNLAKDIYYYEDFLLPIIIDNLPKEFIRKLNKRNSKKYKEIFENKDLIYSAKQFFKNNLNITETSKKIYVHRNTLIYRINKIKEITGFDLKKFDDALKFYIILLMKNVK